MCMKRLVHSIEIRVFEKDASFISGIYDSFSEILPIDFDKEKIVIQHKQAEGFGQNITHILSMKIHRHRHIWLLIQNIFQNLSRRDVEKICKQRDSRLDDHGYFFIRLDKKLLLNGVYKLTEQGSCFHFKIKMASFPSTRENAMKSLEELLEKMECSVTK